MAESSGMEMKLLVDRKAGKVLFGEADKKVVDFLFSLLSLPLGAVIRILKNHSMVGCLPNLYDSVEALSDTYLELPNHTPKQTLLEPKVASSSSCLPMLLPYIINSPSAPQIYLCKGGSYHYSNCRCYNYADDPKAICPQCNALMNAKANHVIVKPSSGISTQMVAAGEGGGGGYVKGVVTYMVMDDLSVKPMSTISSITLLNKFNVRDLRNLEERVVTIDITKGVKLLQASLNSKTVLTDVFIGKGVLETKTEVAGF